MRKLLYLTVLLLFLASPIQAQEPIHLPLILKGDTMPTFPDPILQFISADGKVLDLLGRLSGIEMEDSYWRPAVAQYKDGGQFVNSSIADGRRLVVTNYDNVTEQIPLSIHGRDQAAAVKTLRELLQLNRQAADYWTKPYEYDPVWVAVRPSCNDCRTGYARLVKASIAELPPVYSQPFFGPNAEAVLDDITLVVEREPLWRGVPPGELIGPLVNLLRNSDMELWNFGVTDSQPDNWTDLESVTHVTGTNNREGEDSHSGNYALKVRVSGSTQANRFKGVTQVISGTRANTTYTVVAWVRNDGVSNGVGRILVTYSSQLELYNSSSKHGWQLYTGTFTTGATDTVAINLEILTTAANTDGAVYFDSLMLLEGDWQQEAIDGILPYMTSSHIVNHSDQAGSTLIEAGDLNYVDMWNIPGDESALVRLEMINNTPDSSVNSPIVFQTVRAGMRRTGDVFNFTNFYDPPGVSDTTASGDDRVDSGTLSANWTTVGFFTIDDPELIRDNLGRFRVLARVRDASTGGALNLEVRLRYWIGQAGTSVKTLDSVTVPNRGSWYMVDLTGNAALNWDVKSKNLPGSLGFEIQMRRATGSDQGRLDYVMILPTDGGILVANVSPSVPLDSGLVVDGTNSSDVYGARLPRGWREVYTSTNLESQSYLEDFNGVLYISGFTPTSNALHKFQNNGGTFLHDYSNVNPVPLKVYNNKLYSIIGASPSQAYASDGTAFPGSAAFTLSTTFTAGATPRDMLAFCGKLYIVGASINPFGSLFEWDGSSPTATHRIHATAYSDFLGIGVYKNKFYIAALATGTGFLKVIEVDPITFAYTEVLSTGSIPILGAVDFLEFRGKLYLAAGATDIIYRFDGLTWESLTPLSLGMSWNALTVSGDRLFAAGFQGSQAYVISTTDGVTWRTEYTPGETTAQRGISLAVSQGQIFMGTFISGGSAILHAVTLTENQYKVPDYQLSEFRAPNREWGNPKRHRYFFSYSRESGVDVVDDAMLVGVGVVPQYLSLVGSGAD